MEFEIKKIEYFQRVLKGQLIFMLLAIGLFIYFISRPDSQIFIDIAIPLFVIIFSFIRYEHWYRFYLTKILTTQETISLELWDRNKKVEYVFKIDDLEIVLDKALALGSIYKVIFKEKGKKKFTQYQFGGWDEEKILKMYEALKLSLNHKQR